MNNGSRANQALNSAAHTGQQRIPSGTWWSVDPGEKHVGLAMWQENELAHAEEVTPQQLLGLLLDFEPTLVVIEAFSLRSPRWTNAQSKQAVATVKLIGAVEGLCMERGARVVEQQPSVRHVAQSSKYWRELQERSQIKANAHTRSAIAHGLYYLHFSKR